MKSVALAALTILLLVFAVIAQTPTPTPIESDEVVKITTTLIQVDVNVTDNKGNPIRDLKRDEVEIYENGKKQEISNFSFVSARPPLQNTGEKDNSGITGPPKRIRKDQIRRTIALVVDDLTLSFTSTYHVKRALKDFVDNQMEEGDLVPIIRTSGGIGALQQFTTDKRQLYAAIAKVRWSFRRGAKISAFTAIGSDSLGNDDEDSDSENIEDDIDQFREDIFATGTLGALNYIVRGMDELPGRKSVMLLSDGVRLFRTNRQGFRESTRILDSLKKLVVLANRASVVVYTIDARGLETAGLTAADNTNNLSAAQISRGISSRRIGLSDTQEGLIYLARETGGNAFRNRNDLSGGIRKMLLDQSYYLIGYQPDEEVFDAEKRRFNKLEVKVKRKGVKVRYRSGFFGLTDDAFKKPKIELSNSERIVSALTSPFAVNDLQLSLSTIFEGEADNSLSINSILFIDLEKIQFSVEADGNRKAAFDLLVISFGDNGVPKDMISKSFHLNFKPDDYERYAKSGITYSFNFPVKKPGAYQMRVAIRDHASQKVGSASQFIEVPKLKKNRLALSGVLVDNVSYKQWNAPNSGSSNQPTEESGTQTDMTPLADSAIRRFRKGTVLKYGLEVYRSKLKKGGKPMLETRTRVYQDGKQIFEGESSPVELIPNDDYKVVPVTGAINLASTLTPGYYTLQIEVTDQNRKKKRATVSAFVQFEIID